MNDDDLLRAIATTIYEYSYSGEAPDPYLARQVLDVVRASVAPTPCRVCGWAEASPDGFMFHAEHGPVHVDDVAGVIAPNRAAALAGVVTLQRRAAELSDRARDEHLFQRLSDEAIGWYQTAAAEAYASARAVADLLAIANR